VDDSWDVDRMDYELSLRHGGRVRKWTSTCRQRRLERIAKLRAQLHALIGNKCALAHESGCKGPLTADHPNGKKWKSRNLGIETRLRRYIKEAKRGLVRALCYSHNSSRRPSLRRK
jgi:hypothetical protein